MHVTLPSSRSFEPSSTEPAPRHVPSAGTRRFLQRATGGWLTHVESPQLGPLAGSSQMSSWKPVAGAGSPADQANTFTVLPHVWSVTGKEKPGSMPQFVQYITSGPSPIWYQMRSTSAGLLFTMPDTVTEPLVAQEGRGWRFTDRGGT